MSHRHARTSPAARAPAVALAALSLLLIPAASEARVAPPPPPPPGSTTQFVCEEPVEDPPQQVVDEYEEYYACALPILADWLVEHPSETARAARQYESLSASQGHDLRGRPKAGRWMRAHPVEFSDRRVELSRRQVSALAPDRSSSPASVSGAFQRLFVDRDEDRLHLMIDERGLTSVDISSRYDFEVEGHSDRGDRDFFIVDGDTAYIEERPESGGGRDLVVLDISDPDDPRELRRLRGVLPEADAAGGSYHAGMKSEPPTLAHYRQIKRGEMAVRSCGPLPRTQGPQGRVTCRPDGSCYRERVTSEPKEGMMCERRAHTPRQPVVRGSPTRIPDERAQLGRRAPATAGPSDDGAAAAAPRAERSVEGSSADADRAASAPEGGSGGAGSLSQMMVYGDTLYVLSAREGQPNGWLSTFDIRRPERPSPAGVLELDNGPEALQRHDNLLLVAGRDAIVTASLGRPRAPRLVGEFRQNCPVDFDPVVVQGSVAYRTIIVDSRRRACTSRLEVIDLSQPHRPALRTTRSIPRPRGLAVLGERLFVADETRGVRVFDLTDPVSPRAAGLLELAGVKDLVLSDFDLYAMTPDEVRTYYVGPAYQRGISANEAVEEVRGVTTVAGGEPSPSPWFLRTFLGAGGVR